MTSQYTKCVDASLITKRLEARTVYANLVTQQQLFDEGKVVYIKYQNGGSSSNIVGLGAFGSLITTPSQRDAILASVNGTLPAAPVLLTATAGYSQVTLTWLPSVPNGGLPVSGYMITVVDDADGTSRMIPVGNITGYTVAGLKTDGSAYTFSLYAINAAGNSQASGTLTATPLAPIPEGSILETIYGGGTQKIPVEGYYDGNGLYVQFNDPRGLTFDTTGNLYVADTYNNRIRKIDSSGNVSTFAGNGSYGFVDAQGTNASFGYPQGLTFDSGNLYVADTDNNLIRKIDMSGNVSTFAGSSQGSADGEGTNAAFRYPQGLTFDSGNLYISDTVNNRIRKIDSSGNVSTFAGNSSWGSADGEGTNATFDRPRGLIFDSGSLYVADTYNHRIRKIDLSGNVSTFAGSSQGSAEGQGASATFYRPQGLAFDSFGNLYVADTYNNRIRKIDLSGNVSTFAGSSQGFADGEGTNAAFDEPRGLTFDSSGNLYVADTYNDIIRKIDLSGNVTTLPGGACTVPNQDGDGVGIGTNVLFDRPAGILKTPNGLFIADYGNDSIKKIDNSGNVTDFVTSGLDLTGTFVVGMVSNASGILYFAEYETNVIKKVDTSGNITIVAGDLWNSAYDDGEGTNAAFDTPCGITFDFSGNLYVADSGNSVIRKIDSSGNVSTFAGNGSSGSADGQGTNATFDEPMGMTIDLSGNLYVTDHETSLIRKIDMSGNVSTFAGNGLEGYADAQGTNASFYKPHAITFDSFTNTLYVSDTHNHLIRTIDMSGNVSTILGGGGKTNSGCIDGIGTFALLIWPTALIVDAGVLYICDTSNNIIRRARL